MSKILKGLNEVNPHNYDSDWDYQDAVANSGRSRSTYSHTSDDEYDPYGLIRQEKDFAKGRAMKAAKEKAQRDSDHDRLASGTNEGAPISTTNNSIEPGGAVDNFKQQMANNTEINYKKQQGVGEATGDSKFDSMMNRMSTEPKYPDKKVLPTSIPELIQWAEKNNKPDHWHFAEWAKRNKFTNVNDALEWFGDNVDPTNQWGPKEDPDSPWDGEWLEDAAKHDPRAAELMRIYDCYEKIVFDWSDDYRQMNMPDPFKDKGLSESSPVKQVQQLIKQLSIESKKNLAKILKEELNVGQLKELSNDKLGQYKTAAALDAGKADIQGDYKRADKRFSGIVKATKKQFSNDKQKSNISQELEEVSIVTPVTPSLRIQNTKTYPKQNTYIPPEKKKSTTTPAVVIDIKNKDMTEESNEQSADPFKHVNNRVDNPKILGTQNKAKSAYYPPSKPPVKKLDKPLPENLGNELKSKSLEALQQVKQQLEQQRMADLEQWEKDFKQNTVAKFTAREPNLRQRVTSTPVVAMPGEKHSDLKARLSQLNKAIEKQGILDNLVQKLDKKGLVTPNIEAGVDTSMLVRDGARDNYVELNRKLDKALEYVQNRLLTNKAAYAKPKAIDEDDSAPTRMRMNDYMDLADAIQEKLRHAIQMGDKARIQELYKQRDELDAPVKKHGMMPEDVSEEKRRLDPKCWKGYKKQGTKMKGDTRVNNCVPVKESSIMQGINHLDEGWKEKLGAAALTGAMALGAGAAHGRVTYDADGNQVGGMKPNATVQVEPAPATPSTATIPGKGLVRAERADRQAGTVTVDGQEYKMIMLEPGGIRPRGGQQIVIPQAVMGERGIGNYMAILAGGRVFVLPRND